MFNRCSGNTFIRIDTCELPIFIFLNQLRIVLHLQLITTCLSIFVRTDAAIGANTQLLLFGFKVQLMCCWNDLNLTLGAVQVSFAYGGFGGFLCLGATTARMDFQYFTPFQIAPAPNQFERYGAGTSRRKRRELTVTKRISATCFTFAHR